MTTHWVTLALSAEYVRSLTGGSGANHCSGLECGLLIGVRCFDSARNPPKSSVKRPQQTEDLIVANQETKVRCPLCEGQGELAPSILVETSANPELWKRLEARIAEIAEASGCVPPAASKDFDFHKEVHTWNPTLPIWRRSPKEQSRVTSPVTG